MDRSGDRYLCRHAGLFLALGLGDKCIPSTGVTLHGKFNEVVGPSSHDHNYFDVFRACNVKAGGRRRV